MIFYQSELQDFTLLQGDCSHILPTIDDKSINMIFADPPYDMAGRETLPGLVFDNNWLAEDGWLIIEHDKAISFVGAPLFSEERRYGKVHFSFFRNSEYAGQASV